MSYGEGHAESYDVGHRNQENRILLPIHFLSLRHTGKCTSVFNVRDALFHSRILSKSFHHVVDL